MSKKTTKVLVTILTIAMIISMAVTSFATEPKEIVSDGNTQGSSEITTVGKAVVGILQTVGIILSVIVLIILGIKYMMGSAEEKADYKKSMIPYLVGAILIFAASALAQVVYQFVTGISA